MKNEGFHPWVDRTLEGRYLVRGVLGSGGMGHVLLAADEKTGRTVAVKVPRAELLDTADVRAKFLNEVKVLLRIQHANAVKVLDVGEEEGLPFVVMEHLTGGSLEDVLVASGGRQAPSEVLPWLEQIANVLDWLHRDGNVHRDVKPANILFDSAGQARLSDFGIAKMVRELSRSSSSAMLTLEYAPPEAFLDKGIGPGYDQYSLAATVYRALSGEPPHAEAIRDGAAAALMYARLENLPKDLTTLAPNVPANAASAVMRGLSKEPSQRFVSCVALATAFRAGLVAQASRLDAPPPPVGLPVESARRDRHATPQQATSRPTSSARRRVKPWIVMSLLGVSGVIALVIIVLISTPASIPATAGKAVATGASSTSTASGPHRGPSGSTSLAAPAFLRPDGRNTEGFDVFVRQGDGARVVEIPGGTFQMGSNDGDADAKPAHAVTLSRYLIDEREVTWGQFKRFTAANGPSSPPLPAWPVTDEHPVVNVTWDEAEAYCEWADGHAPTRGRLPTEAEWEFGARGLKALEFPWGNDFDCHRGNFDDETSRDASVVEGGADCDGFDRTAPVGQFLSGASPSGLLDMSGNVWEWTTDWYDPTFYATSPSNDPAGPATPTGRRVLRGGAFVVVAFASGVGGGIRGVDTPSHRRDATGFRCAQSIP